MAKFAKALLLSVFVALWAPAVSLAQTAPAPRGLPQPDKFAEALNRYEPDAVAAAKDYALTFNLKEQIGKSIPAISSALTAQIKGKNPSMTDEQSKLFIDTFLRIAFVDDAQVIEQATILTMLDVFTKDELLALNQFYSTPVGAGIMKKFPLMMGRMPQIMRVMQTYVVPQAIAGARDALKARGVEVKI